MAKDKLSFTMNASVFVGTSVDGFIARPNGALDFLDAGGGGESHGYEEFIATIDALVMGRGTYETVLGFGKWPYHKPVFVLSNKPIAPAPAGAVVEHMSGDPHEIVAALEKRGFKHLYIDGGVTIQRFLAAGLIDRLIVTRVPVLIGSGIPLFGPLPRDLLLKHVATRSFAGGMVQSEYAISPNA
jgi:dihydrofolate reductase